MPQSENKFSVHTQDIAIRNSLTYNINNNLPSFSPQTVDKEAVLNAS